ncbi:MAG: GGDEF domain-containing protein, partial [Thermoguttaceae bacterium]
MILSDRPAAVRRWAEMLEPFGPQIGEFAEEAPEAEATEVIVTDSVRIQRDNLGVVRIGGDGPADASLPEDVTGRELRLACRLVARIVRLRRDRRDGEQLRRQLSQEAATDPLTGLPNRRAWDRTLGRRLADAVGGSQRRGRLCVALLDLDHFKRINDARGHAVGDDVLRAVGRSLCDTLREEDFTARLGGDEFGLLLWVPDATVAAAVVQRVRGSLPSHLAEAETAVVTASVGYG